MPKCVHYGSFLFLCAPCLSGIFRFWQIVILTLNYTALAFNLRDIQVRNLETVLFLDISLYLWICGFTALITELFSRLGELKMIVDFFPTQ